MSQLYTLETFEQKLNDMFPNNHIKILEYNGAYKPIKYQCLDCGKIYTKTRANHMYENKTLCTKCYTVHYSKIRKWILDFLENTDHFELAEPWNGNTTTNLKIKCLSCNRIFEKQPNNLYKRDESTICPYCGDNGAPVLKEDFIKRLSPEEQKNFKVLEYKTMTSTAKFQHSCGYVFTQKPINFLKSCGCPKCNKSISTGELMIIRFLTNNNIQYEYEKHFPDLGRFSYDFYLPNFNMLIEYQGEQHYKACPTFGGENKFEIQQQHDKIKKDYAEKNNIKLICIPYYERNHIDSILQSLLGSTTSSMSVASSEAKEKTPIGDNIV